MVDLLAVPFCKHHNRKLNTVEIPENGFLCIIIRKAVVPKDMKPKKSHFPFENKSLKN